MRCDNLRALPLHSYTLQGSATSPWIGEDTHRGKLTALRKRRCLQATRYAQTDRRPSISGDSRERPANFERSRMVYETQGTFADVSPEYAAFVDKFKAKKTTDDCMTPVPMYDAILAWCRKRYEIPADVPVCRPFWPDGDYRRFDYPRGCIVIDNPPFSILADILRFYTRNGIDYFLFSPALTLFGNGRNRAVNFVVCGAQIQYENGAKVSTSFVTSLGDNIIEVRGDLYETIEAANVKSSKAMPKYEYPDEVATATGLQRISRRGGIFTVPRGEAVFLRCLDAQSGLKDSGIFGGGFILSRRCAAERAAVERAAVEKERRDTEAKLIRWELSSYERAIQDRMAASNESGVDA